MADETTQNTPNSQDSGDAGEDRKLYAGKYKNPEELEKAYKELERTYHDGNERFSRLEEKFDSFSQRIDEGYGRGNPQTVQNHVQPDNDRVLREFYTNPAQVLAEVETRASKRAKEEILNDQRQQNSHAEKVNSWLAQNQDIAGYPELLTYWVGQTDGRHSIDRRLDQAGEKVRKRILELRGKGENSSEPNPETIVEAPGAGIQASGQRVAAQPIPTSGESQLASYALQRNRAGRKPLGQPRQK